MTMKLVDHFLCRVVGWHVWIFGYEINPDNGLVRIVYRCHRCHKVRGS
jgi:hypothetical protein